MHKDTRIVTYIDNFLSKDELDNLQKKAVAFDYNSNINDTGHYGFTYEFPLENIKNDPILSKVKKSFGIGKNMKEYLVRFHLRYNTNKPLPHYDENTYVFLLYLKGEPLLNNGTGFYTDKGSLSSHIGFVENRALFFNGDKILHTNLQSFGDSSPRYSLNIFFQQNE